MSSAAVSESDRSDDPFRDGGAARSTEVADPRLARHVAELRVRLRPLCRDWDAAAFEALLLSIAQTKVRWADGESRA